MPFVPPRPVSDVTLVQHVRDRNDPHGTLKRAKQVRMFSSYPSGSDLDALNDGDLVIVCSTGVQYRASVKDVDGSRVVSLVELPTSAVTKAEIAAKADKATTLAGYGIADGATKEELAAKADLVDGKVPANQLPSYVDDVLEYDSVSAFPAAGEGGKIYVAKDVNKTYRWGGTQYVEISQSLALGETSETAYPGDKGLASSNKIDAHVANTNNPHDVTAKQVGAWNLNGANETKAKSQSILIKSDSGETLGSISIGITPSGLRLYVSDTGISGGRDASSIAIWPSRISVINGDETVNIRWADIITQKIVQQVFYQNGANAELPVSSAAIQDFWKVVASPEIYTAISGKQDMLSPGDDIHVNSIETDSSSNFGNIIIKENNGLAFRGVELSPHGPLERISVFRGKTAFEQVNDLIGSSVSETNPAFSNAVLAVGLNIDTNSVAVLNDIAENFGGFPIEGTATTVGGLLAALAAAIAWLKKNKVGSFESVGGASATVENGVAKLDNFFTESNTLLAATIDARLPYPLYAVPSTGLLKDRAINTTSLASVTVPDNFTDLLVRATVASSLSVTMPEAIATKYGDTFPGEAGEYLITITKTGAAEAYVRTIKLEEVA